MTVLDAARGYALWAPTYSAETVVSALEASVVASFGGSLAGRRLLDVGCGIARRLRDARDAGAVLVVGVDLSPHMLAQATGGQSLAAADVRALPIADGAFDVVWCRLVLGHLSSLPTAYAELARACAQGGSLVVTDFHPRAATAGHRRTFRDAAGEVRELEHHVHSTRDHREAAAHAGFSLVDQREGAVDEPVRDFYERAGRIEAYESQRGLPLVLALCFARQR